MWILFCSILVLIVFIYALDLIINRRKYELAKQFNGSKPLPFFGNTLELIRLKPEEILNFTERNTKLYGKFFGIWVLQKLVFYITDIKAAEFILSSTKHLTKNDLYDLLDPWLSKGLLVSSGQKWFARRRAITPTFHFKILEQFVDIFDQMSNIFIEKLKLQCNGNSFNIYPSITLYTLDVISETAMGTKINAQINKDSKYVKAVHDVTDILTTRFIKYWQRNNFIYNIFYWKKAKRQKEAIQTIHNFTKSVIEARRIFLTEQTSNEIVINSEDLNEIGIKQKLCLLDVLLQSQIDGQPLSDESIREEVDTFMFEGHDTTASAISFFIYCLSKETEIQNKLFEEIKEEYGSDLNAPQTYRSLHNLKYMDLVLKEVLRLYPPVPIIGRQFSEEVTIQGKILPAGSHISVGIINIMRDPENFKDPLKFNPDRFNLENTVETNNPYTFIPFSAGPRNCIGQKFAQLEIKNVISKLLRNFEILPGDEEPILFMSIVLRSKNGIRIRLKPRNY